MRKIYYIIISVIILTFITACQSTDKKEQKNQPDTKKVKTETMRTLTKKQFRNINKTKSAPGDGWELIYYSKEKILISNVTSLIMLRKQGNRFRIDKILDLKYYNLNHSQSEETTEVFPGNNGEQVLLYNSYDSENQMNAEENEKLVSWIANFTTEKIVKYRGNDLKKIAKAEQGTFFNCQYTCKAIKNHRQLKNLEEDSHLIKTYSTAYEDEQIILSTDAAGNSMLSLKIMVYNVPSKKSTILFSFN